MATGNRFLSSTVILNITIIKRTILNYWQIKVPRKNWAEGYDFKEYQSLKVGFTYPQKIENKSDKPRHNKEDIIFIYNNKSISKKYPRGVYLVCRIKTNIKDNSIMLEVLKDLRQKTLDYTEEFTEINDYYNTSKIRKRVQNPEKIDSKYNPEKLYNLLMDDKSVKNILLDKNTFENNFESEIEKSKKLNSKTRLKRLKNSKNNKPKKTKITLNVFIRNPDVVVTVLERADGICELCKQNAPFLRSKDNFPYLEVHHKIKLADGGNDTIENAIAVCPNCHRKLHYG